LARLALWDERRPFPQEAQSLGVPFRYPAVARAKVAMVDHRSVSETVVRKWVARGLASATARARLAQVRGDAGCQRLAVSAPHRSRRRRPPKPSRRRLHNASDDPLLSLRLTNRSKCPRQAERLRSYRVHPAWRTCVQVPSNRDHVLHRESLPRFDGYNQGRPRSVGPWRGRALMRVPSRNEREPSRGRAVSAKT